MAAPYQTGLVVGRFLSVVADSADDTDQEPEIVPMSGTVAFTPQVSAVKVVEGTDVPATVNVAPVSATLDSEGYLSRNGQRGIRLLATDGPTNPTGFTYQVSFALTLGGGAAVVQYNPFPIQVPSGRTVDLTVAAPVPSSSGVSMVQGVGVQDVTVENGEFVFRLTNGAESRTPAPAGGGAVTVESDGLGTYTINGSQVKGLTAEGQLPAVPKKYVDDGLAAKSDTGHTHTTADVSGLDTALAGKAASTHRHTWDQIDGKPATVSGGSSAKPVLASLLALPRYKDQVTDDRPTTFTVGTTDTMNTDGAVTSYLSTYQPAGRQVPAEGRMDDGLAPMEFVFNGSEMQVKFQAMNWGAFTTQVWVDNKPVTVAPVVNNSLIPPSTIGYIYLKWATARSRRIRVMNRGGAIQELRVGNPQDQVVPVADTPLLGLVVDSFGGATDYANDTQTLTEWLSRSLNANVMVSTVGGSGYLAGGQLNQKYGDGARQYLIKAAKLDAILFFGSINDPFQETEEVTRKAFRDTWDAYAAANPTAPIIVFGVQPAGAETTVGMPVHRNNHLMYLEAMAHPRVVGFVDMLGTAKGDGAGPAPWAAGTQYNSASVVAYNGAVYGATVEAPTTFTNATPPASSPYWRQISWIFNGTGNTGNLKKDGNRDYLIGADNTHPMPAAGYAFGQLMASAVLRVMASGSSFMYLNV